MKRHSLGCCCYAATLRNRRKRDYKEDVVMSLPAVLQSPQVQRETLKFELFEEEQTQEHGNKSNCKFNVGFLRFSQLDYLKTHHCFAL